MVAAQWRQRGRGTAVFADEKAAPGSQVGGVPVLYGSLSDIPDMPMLVSIGDNAGRARIQREALAQGRTLASFVADPENYFAAGPGLGSMILAGALVNTGATIGQGCIVNTGAIVEHDCELGDFVHLSPGAVVAGESRIDAGTWIGAGAVVLPRLVIAANAVIGAGAVVIRDIETAGTYVGCPATRVS